MNSVGQDVLAPGVQIEIDALLSEGSVSVIGGGPVCVSFSWAVTPPVRSRRYPRGKPGLTANMKQKVLLGNRMSDWVCSAVSKAHSLGILFWVENPLPSWIWFQKRWRLFAKTPGVGPLDTDYCTWGNPWRKRTRFLLNFNLQNTKCMCNCISKHLVLRGAAPDGRMWTLHAQPYPRGLAAFLAANICQALGWDTTARRLDVDSCASRARRKFVSP